LAKYSAPHSTVEVIRQYATIPPLRANAGELLQIFVNLVTNAVQAMNGRGRLSLTIQAAADLIVISVADTGPGIPAANLSKVFTPFFTTKDTKGTGLGLYIVQTLVKKHGGEISVSSEEGKGTTFVVEFPETALA
jgi:two-component system NtrC family sensor kinase